ncbi:MAG: hypothetical protein IPM21_17215 [Acidobacteria bacterium]|nr:hypothetical protein [Acidobacteriota bacterium]
MLELRSNESQAVSDFRCTDGEGVKFAFEAYGVLVGVTTDNLDLSRKLFEISNRAMLGKCRVLDAGSAKAEHEFFIKKSSGEVFELTSVGEYTTGSGGLRETLELFVRILRLKVSQFAKDRVFVHAGVVCWGNQAIMIPGNSGSGKTTLVAECVKQGALYFSDEYAVLAPDGLVHPFARALSITNGGRKWSEDGIPVEKLGGRAATDPVKIGAVVLTRFEPGAAWRPERLTPGNGIIEVIPHTIPMTVNADLSLTVLKSALSHAIILKGVRGEASDLATELNLFSYNELTT